MQAYHSRIPSPQNPCQPLALCLSFLTVPSRFPP
eukprot:jgi/Botrbrau1/4058/Bobra.152_3s0014.1